MILTGSPLRLMLLSAELWREYIGVFALTKVTALQIFWHVSDVVLSASCWTPSSLGAAAAPATNRDPYRESIRAQLQKCLNGAQGRLDSFDP